MHDADDTWRRDEIESPCVRTCVIHPTERLCIGCLRSLEEITAWSAMSSEERARILAEIPSREPRFARRRGGRSARLKRGT